MNKFIPLKLFLILIGFLYLSLGAETKKLPSPLINKNFPNLEVEDFHTNEKYFTHDKLKNKVSLINVWASWCSTCKAEHKMMMKITKTNHLQIIGINYKDNKKNGNHFLNKLGNPYDLIIFDQLGKLGLEIGVYATPETFIVDQYGIIRYKLIGQITQHIWNKEISPLIKQLQMPLSDT